MGQKQDKTSIDYGNNCNTCFPVGETPEIVYARFSNMQLCDKPWCVGKPQPPNDHAFTLTQRDGNACQWRFEDSVWQVTWYPVDPPTYGSRLIINDTVDWFEYFFGFTLPGNECEVFFTNAAACEEGGCGVGGWGIVTWRLESIELLESLNISTAIDLFMEMFPLADSKRVYKYCKLQDGTNIKILFEPD